MTVVGRLCQHSPSLLSTSLACLTAIHETWRDYAINPLALELSKPCARRGARREIRWRMRKYQLSLAIEGFVGWDSPPGYYGRVFFGQTLCGEWGNSPSPEGGMLTRGIKTSPNARMLCWPQNHVINDVMCGRRVREERAIFKRARLSPFTLGDLYWLAYSWPAFTHSKWFVSNNTQQKYRKGEASGRKAECCGERYGWEVQGAEDDQCGISHSFLLLFLLAFSSSPKIHFPF